MIANLSRDEVGRLKEYPTNYHWLINEIFSITKNWLEIFNDEDDFEEQSEYIDFIPLCISLCLDELYKALEVKKIVKMAKL